ncbi:AHH domain-containing protein [Oceanirhabdus sp. W0125-5]|uniref:AHH domain-containing protein n=1 Tax=Oceanirhabdus sp. W0125-5 TaxID=2999116 RepID=UPI0022F2B9C0|nr:AHH domain-containing protein [Oceanirhabdus sp. W0125-5]WBW96128.1 AHH domain-containing protein [Oceanirhabdus sp. W0125-5]
MASRKNSSRSNNTDDVTHAERLIPGTSGVVTGGNSTKLGQNLFESLGVNRTTKRTPYQAMHIIPKKLKNHPIIKKIGMDFDDASNGIFLRNRKSGGVSTMSRHQGNHDVYNDFIEDQLNKMDVNLSVDQLERQVYNLQQKSKYLMEQGLPMYSKKDKASVDLWQRWFNK